MKDVQVAVADSSENALKGAREIGVAETYKDYKELLQTANADAVVISLPNFIHDESACLAAEKGIHIFVEKPLGRNEEECRDIIRFVEKNDVKLMVGFYQRFLHANQELKGEIDAGILGDIEFISYQLANSGPFSLRFPPMPVPKWWFDPSMVGGGALLDTGSHMIDLLSWLLNDELQTDYVFLGHKLKLPFEDLAVLELQSKTRGTKASLMVGWFAYKTEMRLSVYGTVGSASLGDSGQMSKKRIAKEMSKNVFKTLAKRKIEPYSLGESSKAYYAEMAHFLDCVREDRSPIVTGKEGLACARVIDQAYQLWRTINRSD